MDTQGLFIGGEWVASDSGETFASTNPADGTPVAVLARGSRSDVDRAVAAAHAALDFRYTPVWERAALCERIAEALSERRDALASALSAEQGKPLATEAYAEVGTAIDGFLSAAAHVKHLAGEALPLADPNKRALSRYEARGVYAIVTPWNFPVNIPTEYLAPGIATGNCLVWVPAPTTSHCAVLLAECLAGAGVPPGVLNLVTGDGAVVGDAAVTHPGTHAVGFTGSTATGRRIAERAAGKPLLLELGGNGPTLVFADADLDAAAGSLAAGAFFNAGQCCSATELVLVQRGVADELAELLVAQANQVRLGDPKAAGTTMGPLNNAPVAAKMDRHVADATARGARLVAGGHRVPHLGSELYYAPTVLADVSPTAEVYVEESFGPMLPLVVFDTEAEAMALAHGAQFGLVGSVWTRSASRGFRVAERLRTGIVNINEHSGYWEIHVPFGGGSGTGSGVGRLGGMATLEAMTDLKTITFDLNRF
ncbi:aldehyde dehydrogenase family protein [Actinocatenispora rupis]|uniref:Aldehyde dehydrogenase n=1 Tax=Actinocatenispora rupis TaxID=519421 RepID=A0A8J3JF64_9ACTN|nr:aldehyde dehydrogenase family protein [Actinocatenispora rupis]GID15327.1 aldehyde dehydrogenase [Actinocatenispora rupis]